MCYKHDKCCCAARLESTSCVIDGGILTITVTPVQEYKNNAPYKLSLCMSLPERTGIEPVAISDGTNSYPVIDTNGQPVVSGLLRGQRLYDITYGSGGSLSSGTMPAHFTVCHGLCCMEYSSNAALQTAAQEVGNV